MSDALLNVSYQRQMFKVTRCQHVAQPASSSTTPFRLSTTAYSIHSQQLPSISGGRFSIRNLRTSHAVLTATRLSR